MKTLPINLEEFGFVQREKNNGRIIVNKCGRDFLYYSLHYYFPDKFNPHKLNPQRIENENIFGLKLPSWLMWTGLQFISLPAYLAKNGLVLFINNKQIKSFISFILAFLFSKISYKEALNKIEKAIEEKRAIGIDLGLRYGGMYDHVIFVYGYDADALYVCDTHKVPMLEYTKLTEDNRYFMRLSKRVAQNKWIPFGRVWEVKKKLNS